METLTGSCQEIRLLDFTIIQSRELPNSLATSQRAAQIIHQKPDVDEFESYRWTCRILANVLLRWLARLSHIQVRSILREFTERLALEATSTVAIFYALVIPLLARDKRKATVRIEYPQAIRSDHTADRYGLGTDLNGFGEPALPWSPSEGAYILN